MPFKILKEAGYVPAEIELFHEVALSAPVASCSSDAERVDTLRKLSDLEQEDRPAFGGIAQWWRAIAHDTSRRTPERSLQAGV